MLKIILALMPSFIHVFVRRSLGAKIGKGAKIKMGTLISVPNKNLTIGATSRIGPFVMIQAESFVMGHESRIQSFVRITVKDIKLGSYTVINSFAMLFGNKITVGDHSLIMYYCYIDSTKEVSIGNKVGIGGHSFIFTHGNWQDYLNGGPLAFGPVTLEDNVWIPWRAFIMPNVTIGTNAIIGANSLANKSIPANKVAVGSPAKIIGDTPAAPSPEEKIERLKRIISDYRDANTGNLKIAIEEVDDQNIDLLFLVNSTFSDFKLRHTNLSRFSVIDHPNGIAYIRENSPKVIDFITFLTSYGIRLYREKI